MSTAKHNFIFLWNLRYPTTWITYSKFPSLGKARCLESSNTSCRTLTRPISMAHWSDPMISWYHCTPSYLSLSVASISGQYLCVIGVTHLEGRRKPFLARVSSMLFTSAEHYLSEDTAQQRSPNAFAIFERLAPRYTSGSLALLPLSLKCDLMWRIVLFWSWLITKNPST